MRVAAGSSLRRSYLRHGRGTPVNQAEPRPGGAGDRRRQSRARHDAPAVGTEPGWRPRQRSSSRRFAAENSASVRIPSPCRFANASSRSGSDALAGSPDDGPPTVPPAAPDPGDGGVGGGWRTRSPDGSTPTSRQNRSTLGWYASRVDRPRPEGRGGRVHPGDRGLLIRMDLETMATDRAGEVLVRAVRHQRDEVQADVLVGSDVMEEDLVVAVRARRGRDLTEVLRLSRSPAEDHDQSMSSDTTISCPIEERRSRPGRSEPRRRLLPRTRP